MNSMNTPNTTSIPMSAPRSHSRFSPLGWSTGKKAAALAVGAVLLVGGWAAFRPEKLFVNERVSESLVTTGQNAPQLLSQGSFSSLAHHTEGSASLYQQGDRHVLRLMNFSTSNGPDVHVYLTRKVGTDSAAIKSGQFLDLGVIKGNIGNQNYTLPAGFKPADYEGVSIWCKRFAVNFAGASFGAAPGNLASMAAAEKAAMQKAEGTSAESSSEPVIVTTGAFHQVAHATKGTATITEDGQGNRTLTLKGFQTSQGPQLRLYLYKAEQVKDNAGAKKLVASKAYVDLGPLKSTSGTQAYAVPKNIDLWQYLAVGIWCDKFDVNFGTAPLSSPQ